MPTLVQILGAGRSGTTMLDLMLGNDPRAFSVGEVYAWYRPWRYYHYEGACRCGKTPCPVLDPLKAAREADFHAAVARERDVDFVVDSSKDLSWTIDARRAGLERGLDTVALVLWRHPVNLSHAYVKRGKGPGHWRSEFLNVYERLLTLKMPFRTVNFHELVADPETQLRAICRSIGMPWHVGKERFWEKEHHYLFGSQGAYEQTVARQSKIHKKEPFSEAFQAMLPDVEKGLAADTRVQGILTALRGHDVATREPFTTEERRTPAPTPYPLWYTALRMKSLLRRWVWRVLPVNTSPLRDPGRRRAG